MAAGGLLHLWKEWGIQVMVLASFGLQVFLLALGEIRRRNSSTMLSIALWLAYLSADSTAIYALGHLSVASTGTSREHQLVAFWAPFLLLHLGGPDNITAYSLEDNKLWLRHLQTLVVQVLGAAYVIYLYMTGSGTLLLLATISMFAVGLAKYGERTWALNCGNISSIAGTVDTSEAGIKSFESLRQRAGDDEEDILLGAHSHLNICKGVFTDVTLKHGNSVYSGSNRGNRRTDTRSVIAYLSNLYKLVEMELSLMYDILYTKAAVIHTWYGFCIHSISLLGTSIGFLLFQLSINSSRRDANISYRRADVVISYVLLAGALVVETTSVCRALLSTWTCSFLDRRGGGFKWLLHVITSLRRRVQPASRRLWRGSVGQYGLLHLCSDDRNGIRSRLAKKVGLQDWWNRLHFSGVFSGTDTLSMEDLKMGVLGAIMAIGTGMNSRGSATLAEWTGLDRLEEYYSIDWSVNIDLDKSILVWHIATNMHIRCASRHEGERLDKKLVEATKVLSNYMMFLLVVKPDMLPGRTRPEVYLNACKELDSCWRRCSASEKLSASTSRESLPSSEDSLADWLANLNDGLTKLDTVRGRTNEIFIAQPDEAGRGHSNKKVPEDSEDVYNAVLLFRRLWYGRRDRALAVIFKVWVEMMLYVAEHCSRDSHARQLSSGGEFITIVWLAAKHLDYYSIPEGERRTMVEV